MRHSATQPKTHKRNHSALYHALRLRGVTSDELSRRIGVSRRTLHNIACGNHTSRKTRALIERELRMAIAWNEPNAEPLCITDENTHQ